MKMLSASLLFALAFTACRKEETVLLDLDGDGALSDVDCDDTDATVHPGAPERCDGVDNDCDAAIDEDPVDADTFYVDGDGDGYGDAAAPVAACEAPAGAVSADGDCDDTDPAFHPGAPESDCGDPSDYNCDGSVGYADGDGDGAPACQDCDDADAGRFPGNAEVCDGLDNDCDALVDDEPSDAQTFYADLDGDGHGDPDNRVLACEAPPGWRTTADDCDDLEALAFPGNAEVCDRVDNDCDGAVDVNATDARVFYADADGDQYGDPDQSLTTCEAPDGYVLQGTDCDDVHPTVRPGATEVCDGLDNDCDGRADAGAVDARTFYADADADGYGDPGASTLTCAAPEGAVLQAGDCDDGDAARFPGNTEVCDGLDNDCDGVLDDNPVDAGTYFTDGDDDGYGVDGTAFRACAEPPLAATRGGDCDDGDAARFPGNPEVCDERDNDCDGAVDEEVAGAPVWYRDLDRDGHAGDLVTQRACAAPDPSGWASSADDCEDLDRAVHPGADERCNGYDDDCDREIDEDSAVDAILWYVDDDLDGYGVAGVTAPACLPRAGLSATPGDCDDVDPGSFPGAPEACDGRDNDCDGFDDVLGYWPLDEGTGAVAFDEGDRGLDGSISGGEWTDGHRGGALRLNGTDSRVELDYEELEPAHAISVSLWVRPDSLRSTSWDSLVTKGADNSSALGSSGDSYYLGYYRYGMSWYTSQVSGGPSPLLDTVDYAGHVDGWHHLAATWDMDSGDRAIYVDGVLTASDVIPPMAPTYDPVPTLLGADINGGVPVLPFAGSLDEVRILDCPLDAAQVAAEFSTGSPF
ncbi:MAG: hypothetical protein JXX28_01770 [Deltaproteobacteria bacterium]|nr:hypothetical protein [Deltaproteobacteria bacterium]